MEKLNYKNLWNIFLKNKEQPAPDWSFPIQESGAHPYWMKPSDMQSVRNSFDSYDLFMRPDSTPHGFDYSTNAMNYRNQTSDPLRNVIMMSAGESSRLPINSFDPSPNPFGQEMDPPGPQGVYQHELAHYNEPRLNADKGLKNRGFVSDRGLSPGTRSAEAPAQDAEDLFWKDVRSQIATGQDYIKVGNQIIRIPKKNGKT